jgi:hypothetical protein
VKALQESDNEGRHLSQYVGSLAPNLDWKSKYWTSPIDLDLPGLLWRALAEVMVREK